MTEVDAMFVDIGIPQDDFPPEHRNNFPLVRNLLSCYFD